jgi:hypothetical protein
MFNPSKLTKLYFGPKMKGIQIYDHGYSSSIYEKNGHIKMLDITVMTNRSLPNRLYIKITKL